MGKQYYIPYNPHVGQLEFHNSNSKEILVVSSIRAGKSYAIIHQVIHDAWNNKTGHGVLVCCPTYRMLKTILESEIVDKLTKYDLLKKHNFEEHETTLKNNNKIYYRSLEKPDFAIRGLNISKAFVDEAQLASAYSLDLVRGRLLTTNGTLVLICTPAGLNNHIYEKYIARKLPDVHYIKFKLQDNPIITKEAELKLRRSYDPLMARQELDAEWVNLYTELVYHAFNDKNIGDYTLLPNLPVYAAMDFNRGKNAWCSFQRLGDGRYQIIYEGYGADTTQDLAFQVMKKYPDNKIIVVPDASGSYQLQGVNTTHHQLLRQAGLNNIIERRKNPLVNKRVEVVNATFHNALGERRLLIDRSCVFTIRELRALSYKKDSKEIDSRGDKIGHRTDALGYGIMHLVGDNVGRMIVKKKDFVSNFKQQVMYNEMELN